MRQCEVTLESTSPYSQSKYHDTPKLDMENHKDYEIRTWRERMYVNESGNIFIPPMALKNCLSEAAKFFSQQIPGKGKATYTKHFEAGVLVREPIDLGIKKADVLGEWLHVPSDGRRGGGSRVWKCFPLIRSWRGTVGFYVLDETITPEVFENHVPLAGNFIGIGRFRPRNNGFYGRFLMTSITWK